jgi:tetratricopeptide (TPR) repeat protein
VPARRLLLSASVLGAVALMTACGGGSSRVAGQAGDKALAEKNYQRAVAEYRLDVRANPKSADLRRKLAMALEQAGNGRAATTEFVRVADLLPNDANAQLDAAVRLLLTNQFEDARTRAENVLKVDPKNLQAHIVRGNAMAELGDVAQAVSSMQTLLKTGSATAESLVTLGGLELRQGQSQAAEAAFKQAVVVGATNPNAHIALANYYRAVGRFADAEPELKKALELDPKNIIANRLLAVIYLSSGRAPAAEGPLKAIVEHNNTPESRLGLADYYVSQERDNDALAILNQLVKEKQGGPAPLARIAGIDYKQGRVAAAHKSVADQLSKDPENAQLLVLQGGWLAQENKTDDAYRAAVAAVRADNDSAPAHALLGAMHDRKGNVVEAIGEYQQVVRIVPRDPAANMELAKLHLRSGQPQQAIGFAEQALREQPLNGGARSLLASALLADGQLSRAEAEANLIAKGAPSRPEGHILMGEVLYRRNQPAAARQSFEKALQLDPTSMRASSGLALIEVGSKQAPQMVARLDAQLTKSPKDPRLTLLTGRAHATAGNFAKAEELFRRAITLDPTLAEAYNTLGQLYVQQNKLDQARAEYQALAAKQPNNVQAQTMVAMLLHATGKTAEAKTHYEKIVALDQRASVAANNLAFLYAEEGGNLDIALNLAQSAKAASPDDPDVDDTLGWIYYKKNLPALAIEPLRRSVEKDAKNALYHFHLGMAYVKAGDSRSGRSMLERAVSLGLESTDAAEAQRALASLRG